MRDSLLAATDLKADVSQRLGFVRAMTTAAHLAALAGNNDLSLRLSALSANTDLAFADFHERNKIAEAGLTNVNT